MSKRLNRDGIPVDANDWLVEDWYDLHFGLLEIGRKIAKRHAMTNTNANDERPSAALPPDQHFNGLTPAQAERLAWLMEECGEVIQVIGKIQRHGLESKNPLIENSETNRGSLERELGDVLAAIDLMVERCDLTRSEIDSQRVGKAFKVMKWMHHQ